MPATPRLSSTTSDDDASAPAGLSGVSSMKRRHHPVIATVFLGLVFLFAAVMQTWHTHRTHLIDHAITTARTEQACLLRYVAGYERQLRGLLLPGSVDRGAESACRLALKMLEASPSTRPAEIADLARALDKLDVVKEAAAVDVDALVDLPTTAAYRLGFELNELMRSLNPPLERRIAELENRRAREEKAWDLANLILITLLALGSMIFVWRLTRRLSTEHAFAQGVIETSPVAILWKDRQGRLLGYNDVFAKFHGFSLPGEGLGKNSRDLGLGEEEARLFDAQERYVLENGQSLLNVQEQVGPPGRQKWLSISRVPMRDARGRIIGVLINFTEESDRVKSEQLALEMSGRLAMGLNAAHGGEWEWNVQTGELNLSNRWVALFDLKRTPEADHFDFFRDRVHPDDMPAIEAALNEHFSGRCSAYRVEYRIKTGDGTYRWTLGCGRVVERDAQSQPVRMQGLNLDIHPAKEAQEELQDAAERAYSANRAKSAFLATMSHELRTPLSGVIGMTELLRDTALDDRQRSLVAACRFSGRLLLDLINGLLDFSKIEAGHMNLDHEPFSPERCVWSTAAVMALHAHRDGLELDVEIGDGVPPMCLGDCGRLRQVLVNLLANAVKFTEAGRVRVRLSATDDSISHALSFAVTDTGIGIPADKQATLFEPFVQTDPSVTRRYGGTGLGLSISRSLVEAMGGRIEVDSTEGRGSTFTVTVPLEPTEPATPPPADEPLRGRVQLTDPDPASRPRLTQRLRALGLEVIETTDQPAACDLRVTNVRAQMRTGAACELRPTGGDPDPTPHLVLTPVTCPAPPPGAGPTRALTKPCGDRQLANAIRALLSGNPDAARPVVSHPVDAPTLPDPADTETPDAQVLLVEDDLTNRLYLAELLRRQGVACNASTDGRDAVDRFVRRLSADRTGYRLVLMDYHLPEMDGWTATRAIRDAEAAAGADAAVVLGVTAAAGADDRAAGMAAGVTGWLNKPIDPAALQAAIKQHAAHVIPKEAAPPLDADAALERCMGDTAFLSATLDSFAQTLPAQVDAYEAALDAGNTADAGATAHAIKGAAGLVTAFALRDVAARCETLGAEATDTCLDEMRDQLHALRAETQRCVDHATRIRADLKG